MCRLNKLDRKEVNGAVRHERGEIEIGKRDFSGGGERNRTVRSEGAREEGYRKRKVLRRFPYPPLPSPFPSLSL